MDAIARALGRMAFIAGAAAAIAMAQLIPRFADISGIDSLRGLQALIQGWRALAGRIGGGPPAQDVVTVLLFAVALAVPVAVALSTGPPPQRLAEIDFDEYRRQMRASRSPWAPVMKVLNVIGITFVLVALYADAVAPDLIALATNSTVSAGAGPFALIFSSLFVGLGYIIALALIRGYLSGFIVVLALTLAAQALTLFEVPWLSDQIRALAETTRRP